MRSHHFAPAVACAGGRSTSERLAQGSEALTAQGCARMTQASKLAGRRTDAPTTVGHDWCRFSAAEMVRSGAAEVSKLYVNHRRRLCGGGLTRDKELQCAGASHNTFVFLVIGDGILQRATRLLLQQSIFGKLGWVS